MATMPDAAWLTARRAANHLVGGSAAPDVVRGVLAQWVAENGWVWPPPRRNPGNLARGWAVVFPYPYTVQTPNPQPANPIVTFATTGDGALCYAAGLRTFDRYNAAQAAAVAGHGLAFAVAVCNAGYGTRESTVRTVYAVLGPEPGTSQVDAAGGANVAVRWVPVTTTSTRFQLPKLAPLYDHPGGQVVTRSARDQAVPHLGLAGTVNGRAWRAVVVKTAWGYSDGQPHRTMLYVPASSGKVVPA